MTQGMAALTRAALLDRIVPAIAREPGMSLARLAQELGVGRTTLYRYFTDRETLLGLVAATAARRFVEAAARADPYRGTGAEAVERLCVELFELPEVLSLMFADNPLMTDAELDEATAQSGVDSSGELADPFEIAIRRGQTDGSIDASVPAEWASIFVFFTLASGHLHADETTAGRQASLSLVLRAIRRTLFVASPS